MEEFSKNYPNKTYVVAGERAGVSSGSKKFFFIVLKRYQMWDVAYCD